MLAGYTNSTLSQQFHSKLALNNVQKKNIKIVVVLNYLLQDLWHGYYSFPNELV